LICIVCQSEFNEHTNPKNCPFCGENYLSISLADYQKLAVCIKDKQFEIEQLFNQVYDAIISDNKFKNHLNRECDIYRDIKIWFELLMKDFNIPKIKGEHRSKPYYNVPHPCQFNQRKVCNGCGNC
jgi:hypothetical protein